MPLYAADFATEIEAATSSRSPAKMPGAARTTSGWVAGFVLAETEIAEARERTAQGVAIRPPFVPTTHRPPHRRIESTEPTPGTSSPRVTRHTPSGPSKVAVPPITSRTVQPSMVVGLVSGNATGLPEGFIARPAEEAVAFDDP